MSKSKRKAWGNIIQWKKCCECDAPVIRGSPSAQRKYGGQFMCSANGRHEIKNLSEAELKSCRFIRN
jgi:hypothetical protein